MKLSLVGVLVSFFPSLRIQNGEITIAYYSVLICVIRVNLWLSGLEFSLAHLVKTHVGDAFTLMRREVLDIS